MAGFTLNKIDFSIPEVLTFVPRIVAQKELGESNSGFHKHIQDGLIPPTIKVGARKSALPRHELEAVKRAVLAGISLEGRRALVAELVALRKA